jgi:phosphoglucosamine mutase
MSEIRFGTDGIRDVAGQGALAPGACRAVGAALAAWAGARAANSRPWALVARDPRPSGEEILRHLGEGLAAGGVRVRDAGILTTPALSLLCRRERAPLGIVISASHNPVEYNGIKVFGPGGAKLADAEERAIEARIREKGSGPAAGPDPLPGPDAFSPWPEAEEEALRALLELAGKPAGRRRVVLDCAYGAGRRLGPRLLEAAGQEVVAIHTTGGEINKNAGALHPEYIQTRIHEGDGDLGVALDGDGDRALFCDDQCELFDGDDVLALLASSWKSQGRLRQPVVVGTVLSNFGLERALRERGIALERAPVGDRYVADRMREVGAVLGSEPSGHVVVDWDGFCLGDGLVTALLVLHAMAAEGQPLSKLRFVHKAVQATENIRTRRREPLEGDGPLPRVIRDMTEHLRGRGRLVVRYSGTEPLLRIMAEAEGDDDAFWVVDQVKQVAERVLGGQP